MPLSPGTSLGPYKIESPLGAGGMGEVYRATDTRLDRTVAIKVLPEHVAQDPDLKQRFEREARTVAALNHPHICTLYDIGNQDGIDFLVMEYLDGETLAQRLEKGALPLDQALQIAIEIADALDKAHRQGIVHRDLKPGNIMLTKAGAKLLDFGLAKLKPVEQSTGLSALPTQGAPLTQEGSILGTFQYMAPEQLEGQEADTRTDIFSFGAVVYEMVTGKKAFDGKSQASLISAIMTANPVPISSRQRMSPRVLDSIVVTCLAKDANSRWQSIADVKLQLGLVTTGAFSDGTIPGADLARPNRQRALLHGLIGALVGGAVVGLAVWNLTSRSEVPPATMRFSLGAIDVVGGNYHDVAISADGSQIVYRGRQPTGSGSQLFLRGLDQLHGEPLRGTENFVGPFFSPNGEWVGFQESSVILGRISVFGGEPQRIATLPDAVRGASWGRDDQIIVGTAGGGLLRVPASGGDPVALTSLDPETGETTHRFPSIMPGDRAVLFAAGRTEDLSSFELAVLSLESGEIIRLGLAGIGLRYAATGHLVYVADDRTLRAVAFDLDRLAVTGRPVALVEGLAADRSVQAGLSDNGQLVYLSGGAVGPQSALSLVDRQGETLNRLDEGRVAFPRLSPDGTRLARYRDGDIWIRDLERANDRLLTEGIPSAWGPGDGTLTYSSNQTGNFDIYSMRVDDTGTADVLVDADFTNTPGSWSTDGSLLVYYEIHPETRRDLWILSAANGERRPFLVTEFDESNPRLSPDGRWIAYTSNQSGENRIYVRPFPEGDRVIPVSPEQGSQAIWSRSGQELFYRSRDRLWAVPVSGTSEPTFGEPTALFDVPLLDPGNTGLQNYDVSLDGQQFLIVQGAGTGGELTLVLNFFEELKARVPTN